MLAPDDDFSLGADAYEPLPVDWRNVPPLVLERSLFMRSLLTGLLREAGAQDTMVTACADSTLRALHEFTPSLLICDWPDEAEPAEDRMRLIKRIRETQRAPYRDIPIIMVTRARSRQEVEKARDVGATEFLITPLAPITLKQRLDSLQQTPRNFVDSSRYSGPCRRRRPRREEGPAFKRTADVDEGLTTPMSAARAAALSLVQETQLTGDPLSIRVGRSLKRFIASVRDYTEDEAEVVDMHRAALAQLNRMADQGNPLREPVVTGLEQVVATRLEKR